MPDFHALQLIWNMYQYTTSMDQATLLETIEEIKTYELLELWDVVDVPSTDYCALHPDLLRILVTAIDNFQHLIHAASLQSHSKEFVIDPYHVRCNSLRRRNCAVDIRRVWHSLAESIAMAQDQFRLLCFAEHPFKTPNSPPTDATRRQECPASRTTMSSQSHVTESRSSLSPPPSSTHRQALPAAAVPPVLKTVRGDFWNRGKEKVGEEKRDGEDRRLKDSSVENVVRIPSSRSGTFAGGPTTCQVPQATPPPLPKPMDPLPCWNSSHSTVPLTLPLPCFPSSAESPPITGSPVDSSFPPLSSSSSPPPTRSAQIDRAIAGDRVKTGTSQTTAALCRPTRLSPTEPGPVPTSPRSPLVTPRPPDPLPHLERPRATVLSPPASNIPPGADPPPISGSSAFSTATISSPSSPTLPARIAAAIVDDGPEMRTELPVPVLSAAPLISPTVPSPPATSRTTLDRLSTLGAPPAAPPPVASLPVPRVHPKTSHSTVLSPPPCIPPLVDLQVIAGIISSPSSAHQALRAVPPPLPRPPDDPGHLDSWHATVLSPLIPPGTDSSPIARSSVVSSCPASSSPSSSTRSASIVETIVHERLAVATAKSIITLSRPMPAFPARQSLPAASRTILSHSSMCQATPPGFPAPPSPLDHPGFPDTSHGLVLSSPPIHRDADSLPITRSLGVPNPSALNSPSSTRSAPIAGTIFHDWSGNGKLGPTAASTMPSATPAAPPPPLRPPGHTRRPEASHSTVLSPSPTVPPSADSLLISRLPVVLSTPAPSSTRSAPSAAPMVLDWMQTEMVKPVAATLRQTPMPIDLQAHPAAPLLLPGHHPDLSHFTMLSPPPPPNPSGYQGTSLSPALPPPPIIPPGTDPPPISRSSADSNVKTFFSSSPTRPALITDTIVDDGPKMGTPEAVAALSRPTRAPGMQPPAATSRTVLGGSPTHHALSQLVSAGAELQLIMSSLVFSSDKTLSSSFSISPTPIAGTVAHGDPEKAKSRSVTTLSRPISVSPSMLSPPPSARTILRGHHSDLSRLPVVPSSTSISPPVDRPPIRRLSVVPSPSAFSSPPQTCPSLVNETIVHDWPQTGPDKWPMSWSRKTPSNSSLLPQAATLLPPTKPPD